METDGLTTMQQFILGLVREQFALRRESGIVPEVVSESLINSIVLQDVGNVLTSLVDEGKLNCYRNVNKIRMFYPDGAALCCSRSGKEDGGGQ